MSATIAVLFVSAFVVDFCAPVSSYTTPNDPPKNETDTLRLLFSIFRHGDRIQTTSYPNDPYKNLTYSPYGYGQLTNVGIRKNFKLGQTLRENYDDFLGHLFYDGIVKARSTDYDRTKTSLMATLAGLFPPHPRNVWSHEDELAKLWMPIPFSVSPRENDTILFGLSCTKAKKYYKEYKQTSEYQSTFNKHKDLFNYIEKNTGLTISSMSHVRSLHFFYYQEAYGLTLPEWTKSFFPDQLTDAVVDAYYANSATPQLKKYLTGFFFKEMIEEIQKKMAGTLNKGRKIYLYSGHEINIAYTMITLGIMYNHYPKFCENLTFEVHEIKGEYYVRILHQEFLNDQPKTVTIPGYDEYCTFKEFMDYLSDTLPGPEDNCYD